MQKISLTASKTLFGYEYVNREVINMPISRENCDFMIKTRKCYTESMSCDSENCMFEPVLERKFEWFRTLQQTAFLCVSTSKTISAPSPETILFYGKSNTCTAKDLFCLMQRSTIIWDEQIIHKCKLQYIQTSNFSSHENYLYSKDQSLLFQIQENHTICNMELYSTAEGLYITQDDTSLKLNKADLQIDIMKEILLADSDFKTIELHKETLRIAQLQNIKYCKLLVSQIKLLTNEKDQFFTLNDNDGEEIILENRQGIIYVPNCIKIHLIQLRKQTSFCTNHVEVSFIHKNETINGYLNQNGLITQKVQGICSTKEHTILIPEKQVILKKQERKIIEIIKLDSTQFQKLALPKKLKDSINFKHDKILFEDIDLFNINNDILQFQDETSFNHVEPMNGSMFAKIIEYTKHLKTSWINIFHHFLLCLVFLICLIFTLTLITIFLKKYLRKQTTNERIPELPHLSISGYNEHTEQGVQLKEENATNPTMVNWEEIQHLINEEPGSTRMSKVNELAAFVI